LQTAAAIRVTTSACYEHTVDDRGTAQAINDIVWESQLGRKVRILDLETGILLRLASCEECTVGEYIFWRSLEEVLATDLKELKKLKLVMIRDPGKARTVTKGRACLKIVLDVVNKLTAKPFAKAYPSSTSGLEKANHGWNLFKSFFTGDLKQMVFQSEATEELPFHERQILLNTIWKTVFALSTDYETATDLFRHDIGGEIGDKLMLKIGIPSVLRGIVNATCFEPRTVEFTASGGLSNVGNTLNEKENVVTVVNGIMMGDPLTKILLHTINMCVRTLAEKVIDHRFLSTAFANAAEVNRHIADLILGPRQAF